jgi:hypothetical protein
MTLRCLCLAAVGAFVTSAASTQDPPAPAAPAFALGPNYTDKELGHPCGQKSGLDPSVLPIDMSKMTLVQQDSAVKKIVLDEYETLERLDRILGASLSAEHQDVKSTGSARWYVNPITLQRSEGQLAGILGFGAGTKIQEYGETYGERQPAPVYVCGADGLVIVSYFPTTRTAMPANEAKSLESLSVPGLLKDQDSAFKDLVHELDQLEVVAVPLARPFDKDYDTAAPATCSQEGGSYIVVSTLTMVPRAVFDEGSGEGTSSNAAVFPAATPSLRRTKVKLETEAGDFIERLRHRQRGRTTVCYSPTTLELWSRDVRDGPKEWKEFWESVEQRLVSVVKQEGERKMMFPQPLPPPPAVKSGDSGTGQSLVGSSAAGKAPGAPGNTLGAAGKTPVPTKNIPQDAKGKKGELQGR